MRRAALLLSVGLLLSLAPPVVAQDAVEVDPGHYSVVFENDEVRVLRITYGPGETSVMHDHPAGVAVFVTDMQATFTLPDGSTQELSAKAGDTVWAEAGSHLPENTGDEPFVVIQVELKQ